MKIHNVNIIISVPHNMKRLSVLGSGSHGRVYKCQDELTGEYYAVKPALPHEADILKKLKGIPGVLKFVKYENSMLFTEVAGVMELYDFIEKVEFDSSVVKKIFMSLATTIRAVHAVGIMHRDLKPSNIMIDPNTQKITIIDWGYGEIISPETMHAHPKGNLIYSSPEMLDARIASDHRYMGPMNDVWALGGILFSLLAKEIPYHDRGTTSLFRQIRSLSIRYYLIKDEHAKSLLRRIFVPLERRATLDEIISHPWLI